MAIRRRDRGTAALVFGIAFGLAAACGSGDPLDPCGTIPAGGCPIGRGGTCSDETCTGVYDCVGGVWRSTERCPGGSSNDAGLGGEDASTGRDAGCGAVSIDHTGETIGCKPDLQVPDCPTAVIGACAAEACSTGCTDFFLCVAGGWSAVAYCDDSGQVLASGKHL